MGSPSRRCASELNPAKLHPIAAKLSKMAWKHKAQAPRQYTTFLRDDETIRQNYLRLDDVTFKRLQLYERKMKGKTTEELLASVEKATKKNSEDLAKMNQAMYELAEDSKKFNKRVGFSYCDEKDPDLTASSMLRQKWDLKLYSDDVAGGMARIEERMLTRMNQSDKLVAILFKEITGREF